MRVDYIMFDSDDALVNFQKKKYQLSRILFCTTEIPLSLQNYQKARKIMLSCEKRGYHNVALRLFVRHYGEYALKNEKAHLAEILQSLNNLKKELNAVSNNLIRNSCFSRESFNKLADSLNELSRIEKELFDDYLGDNASLDNDEKFTKFKMQCVSILTEENFSSMISAHIGDPLWRVVLMLLSTLEKSLNTIFVYLSLASPIQNARDSFFSTRAEGLAEKTMIALRL